ncbi:MAG: translation initiation factor IF-6 [Nanoarchaeota archaeon]|nr:translation initiation factor IF-6 [Nanoarchaeota archaeon]
MHVEKMDINGSSLVGLYVVPLDEVVLVGHDVPESLDKTLEEVFGVPVRRISIAGTSLIGAFLATDGHNLLVPHILFPHEEEAIKDLSYCRIETNHTCLGNNIVFTEKGMLVNPDLEPHVRKQLEETFHIPVGDITINEVPTIGSLLAHNGTHGLITNEVTQAQLEQLQDFLGLELTGGSVNMGATHISSGVAVNKNGFIIGESSGGPEIINADQAFGFLDK